ncbi:MAG: proline--tRNA ligase [Epsilonproteobacteria bacterium]|nr:MAG: proline--tRNA ligase [Campylobacterota bacterium]
MRYTNIFIPTTKEIPSDAVLPSHKYLLKAGFVCSTGSGLYDYLPLGKIVLDNIKNIVKNNMDKAKANEISLSFVTPLKLWEQSGRIEDMGQEMLKFKDRHQNNFVLSPTNEEAVVTVVKNRIKSYKHLPVNLYQINTKFRDEVRPRFGILRAREFLMKDAYSFSDSQECLQQQFDIMETTYKNILNEMGLKYKVVKADSGAIGGDGSLEFHIVANSGEDTIVVCMDCEFGANIETMEDIDDKLNETPYNELENINIQQKCSCGGKLVFKKGIEVGHIFQLKDKYSKALDATFLDSNGKQQHFMMGCYGMGISRIIAAAVEQNHDDKGAIWPLNLTPYKVCIIVSNGKDNTQQKVATDISNTLEKAGISNIIDDRVKERFGFKMADFELIGYPYAIVVGKNIADGKVEIVDRKTLEKSICDIDKILETVLSNFNT